MPETVPSVPQPAEPQQIVQPKVVLPSDLKWQRLYVNRKNPDVMNMYERARKLVEEQRGATGELNLWANYFGPWVIVVLEPPKADPELMALDAPPPVKPAFLVDMTTGKVVESGDWKTARPFIEAQIAAYRRGFDDAEDRQEFLNFFASSLSVIAFGDTDYLEDPGENSSYPNSITGPQLKYSPDKSEFTYFLMSHGMTLSFTECKLTITSSSIVFNSSLVGFN